MGKLALVTSEGLVLNDKQVPTTPSVELPNTEPIAMTDLCNTAFAEAAKQSTNLQSRKD
jgi:hypothetical protein